MKRKRVLILAIVLAALAAAALGIQGFLTNVDSNLAKLADMAPAQIDLTTLADGVYTGSYSVFPVSAKVSVTAKDHRITAIDLVEHKNGQGAGAEAIPGEVLKAQSLQVDSVSGATYSSKVILKAIENALLGGRP
jgi:uncharacterized protein with FMN-binding domain